MSPAISFGYHGDEYPENLNGFSSVPLGDSETGLDTKSSVIFEAGLSKHDLVERVHSLDNGCYRVFIVGETTDGLDKSLRSGTFSAQKKKSLFGWRNDKSTRSKTDTTNRPNPLQNLKKAFAVFVQFLTRKKPIIAQPPPTDQIQTATEACSIEALQKSSGIADSDEYERILEDLADLAEERIKTLIEASSREQRVADVCSSTRQFSGLTPERSIRLTEKSHVCDAATSTDTCLLNYQ